ncbi:MAG: ribosome biogenesis GTP-binding protein YihA/YsxC [Mariprofundaceae bacterium]|nr:ribosome biogenesis GTP-binding protein YihA/YsxC [Mariprofundaceae bacterium]
MARRAQVTLESSRYNAQIPDMDIRWENTQFVQSVADMSQFPDFDLPQVAIAGHSNVGKSSLLNALFGRKGLVKTSKAPGCTRLLNLFTVDEAMLVIDLPGYGFARAAKKEQANWRALIEHYLAGENSPRLVLSLMDIRHGPKDSDLRLIEWLNDRGLRWLPVATKSDKLSGNARGKRLQEMTQALGGMLSPLPTSCLNKRGIDDLREMLQKEMLTL